MKKKIIIISVIGVIIVGAILGIYLYKKSQPNDLEKEVLEIVSELNNSKGYNGAWKEGLHISKVIRAKKIDISLLNDKERADLDNDDIAYMLEVVEDTYGKIQIIVVNNMVTANEIYGETYYEMWDEDIFVDGTIDIDKINSKIKSGSYLQLKEL